MMSDSIVIEAGVLASAMKDAAAIVQSRNTVPIMANACLRAEGDRLEIVTSDLEVEFRQQVELRSGGTLATTADARRLAALASAAEKGAQMKLSLGDTRLTISSGRSRWVLPVLPADDFPVMGAGQMAKEVAMPAKDLAEALARVTPCISTEETRYYLNGILFHPEEGQLRFAATDGHKLAAFTTDQSYPADAPEIIVPRRYCEAMQRLAAGHGGTVSFAWDTGKIRATIGPATLTGKVIDGTFPDYRRVIPPTGEPALVDPALLRAAIKRVQLVSTEKTRAVRLARSAGKMVLSVTSPEAGEASEEVAAENSVEQECGFNSIYLDTMLAAIGGDSIEIHHADPAAPALFRRAVADGMIGVVMPMRV